MEVARSLSDPGFLAAICHDLRGPLGAIGTWIHVLASGRADAPTQEQALAAMERDARAQGRMIDQLAALSSILAGKLRPSIREVDFMALVESLGARLQVAGPLPASVLADPDQILELFALVLPVRESSRPEGPPALDAEFEPPRTIVIRGPAREGGPGPAAIILARALAELQGGRFTLSPEAKGSSFAIHLSTPEP
jgi:phospho-acceptor domain-containing protein